MLAALRDEFYRKDTKTVHDADDFLFPGKTCKVCEQIEQLIIQTLKTTLTLVLLHYKITNGIYYIG